MSSPELAVLRVLHGGDPTTLRPFALQGVEKWAGVLLPLRIRPGDGVEVWHLPRRNPGEWLNARTLLSVCCDFWPQQTQRRLARHPVHADGGQGALFWRAAQGLSPSSLAGALLALHLDQVRQRPKAQPP